MEYTIPVILFVVGFGGALLARRAATWAGRRRGPKELHIEKGVVRLDQVSKKRENRRRS